MNDVRTSLFGSKESAQINGLVEMVQNNWNTIEDWIFDSYELINNLENSAKSLYLTGT